MKRIVKITPEKAPRGAFAFEGDPEPTRVQGGLRRAEGCRFCVESGGRYKLFCDKTDFVRIDEGAGFIKWARGEIPFREGEVLLAEEAGEYELNGKCRFFVFREE